MMGGAALVDGMPTDEDGLIENIPDGRAIQFPTSQSNPDRCLTMRLWHSDLDGTRTRFKLSPIVPYGSAYVLNCTML